MASKRRFWPWLIVAVLLASVGMCTFYMFVPYERGPSHQTWTVTVTNETRTESSTGFGLGPCGEEGPHGASIAKHGALERACFAARLCPGDAVCDCKSRAQIQYRCETGHTAGRSRIGDLITVPVH